jgi:hypothetical protein
LGHATSITKWHFCTWTEHCIKFCPTCNVGAGPDIGTGDNADNGSIATVRT